jgi:hypothetical protein
MKYTGGMRALYVFVLMLISYPGFSQGRTIRYSIPVPRGYLRETYPSRSYSDWIQNLPLKAQPVILDYQGRTVASGLHRIYGVVRMPLLFQSDLEQCADFAMRLWAEYHKAASNLDKFYLFDYSGKKISFQQSGKSFANFLKRAFANTNSHSLKNGCRTIAADQIIPGDMLVQNERGGIANRDRRPHREKCSAFSFSDPSPFHGFGNKRQRLNAHGLSNPSQKITTNACPKCRNAR